MKILVLGGAGMLGHQIFLKLQKAFGESQVGCTLRKPKSHYDRFQIFKKSKVIEGVDVFDFTRTQEALFSYQPDVIVNCIGLTLRKKELADIEKCYTINGMLPHRLAKWGMQNNCKVIHFSTDCVFDGKKGNYTENDVPTADDPYGQSKFLGEIQHPNSLTLRLSIVGRELEGKTELLEWFLSQKGKSVQGYSKALYSGLTTNKVADEVVRILQSYPQLQGLYQVASQPISKFELLKMANEIFECKTEVNEKSDYIVDKTLSCDRYSSTTGFKKPSWKEMLVQLKKEEQVNYDGF